jgi:hypothetical protein
MPKKAKRKNSGSDVRVRDIKAGKDVRGGNKLLTDCASGQHIKKATL